MSRPYAEVIGDPIAHSRSPLIHNFWLAKLGIDAEYRATRVTRDDLPAYLAARRADPAWRGCNVTMPLKVAALAQVDIVEPHTSRIGATNCVHRLEGGLAARNLDWGAVLDVLDPFERRGLSAVIVGSGGAARAAVAAMDVWAADITIVARDQVRGEALAEVAGRPITVVGLDHRPEADILINATPLGMQGRADLELDLDAMPDGAIVLDMVYQPARTRLLERASARGLGTVGGLAMLCSQAAASFLAFFGKYPEDALVAAARDLAK